MLDQKSIVIYIFIADSFVNEIFGDNMITLTHKNVHPVFRPLFSPIFHVRVGEFTGTSAIIGRCISRSTNAADMINQWRTWDVDTGHQRN